MGLRGLLKLSPVALICILYYKNNVDVYVYVYVIFVGETRNIQDIAVVMVVKMRTSCVLFVLPVI